MCVFNSCGTLLLTGLEKTRARLPAKPDIKGFSPLSLVGLRDRLMYIYSKTKDNLISPHFQLLPAFTTKDNFIDCTWYTHVCNQTPEVKKKKKTNIHRLTQMYTKYTHLVYILFFFSLSLSLKPCTLNLLI